jgi:monosaccharide-transporting ATPase
MSVARNLLLGREPRRRHGLINIARMNVLASTIVAGFALDIDVRRPLGSFGTGVQQLVAVARAVSAGTPVVIMDEPTAGLEPDEAEQLFAVIADLRARGRSVVYVTHRLQEIERICDRVTVLRDGRPVHTGPLTGLDRLRLVSLMLGRRVAAGTAVLGGVATKPADPPGHRAHRPARPRRRVDQPPSRRGRRPQRATRRWAQRDGEGDRRRNAPGLRTGDHLGDEPSQALDLRSDPRGGEPSPGEPQGRGDHRDPVRTVRDNIVLAALPRLPRAGIVSEARLDHIVETFMKRLRIKAASPHQPVAELSGGTQQKVLLARWLATNPRVLMLDEPTRGIDIGTKVQVQALIDDLAVEGLAVILISSDLQELIGTCDRVVVLRDGAVVRQLSGPDVTEKNIMALLAAD